MFILRSGLMHRLVRAGIALLCACSAQLVYAAGHDGTDATTTSSTAAAPGQLAAASGHFVATPAHIAAARDVLQLLRVRDALPPMVAQLGAAISGQIGTWDVPEDQLPEVEKTIVKINEALASELNWQKLEEDYLVLYTESFSKAELKEISRFFHSATGSKYIASVPGMQQKSLNIDQLRFARVQPQLEALLGDLKRHLDALALERHPPATAPPQ